VSGVVTIVQARTGSTRLPGKVMLPLGNGTVLSVLLSRVCAAQLAGTVVVATTTSPADDVIAAIARESGVGCYRGHPTDLLDRHYQAAVAHNATYVVKIPSDCPLIDPAVIDAVIGTFLARSPELDYASNLHPPSHPDGNDVEIMRFGALEIAWCHATQSFEREHTTPYLWNRPDSFRLANIAWEPLRNCAESHRVVLDYPEDYDVIRAVHAGLASTNALYTASDVVRYLDAQPQLMARNAQYRGVHWYRHHLHELPGLFVSSEARTAVAT
jgi:spore coat polysaccharide biosynthesis protein SpsF